MAKKSDISIAPLGDRVVVKLYSKTEEQARGIGLVLPDSVKKEKLQMGTVVAVGPGKVDDGVRIPLTVQIGHKVLLSSEYGSYEEIKVDDEEYYILSESKILAVIK